MKKIYSLIVIILLLIISIYPNTVAIETMKVNVNILYVGGSGPGNYTRIQDAIDNASDGDTVFVYNGIYYENVFVNKTIELVGEDRNFTVIKGMNDIIVVQISADMVTFHDFTINTSHIQNQIGGALYISSSFNIISENNVVDNNWIGIYVNGSSNLISRNIVTNNFHCGIYLGLGDSNLILNNTVTMNKKGIFISNFCDNITISGNFVLKNREDGIYVIVSKGHTIEDNHISSNNYNGIYLREIFNSSIIANVVSEHNRGIYSQSSSFNYFIKNIITNNNFEGINLYDSHFNFFSENTITNSERGFILFFSRSNSIKYNNIMNNSNETYFVNSLFCRWNGNYWGSNIERIKIIRGLFTTRLIKIPVFAIDLNPAKEPFDI